MSARMLLTDDEGRFTFTDLPAGTYAIDVRKAGWLTGHHGARQSWQAPGVPVVLGDGDRRDDVVLRITRGAVITGRLIDEFGQPVEGARVVGFKRETYGGRELFRAAGDIGSRLQGSDDRGDFRLFGLPPGEYIVAANVLAARTSTRRSVTTPEEVRWAEQSRQAGIAARATAPPPGSSVAELPVYYPGTTRPAGATILPVGIGEERDGVDFTLGLSPSATVDGLVTTPDGKPAPGVPLYLMAPDRPVEGEIILTSSPSTRRSGRDGSFSFSSVAPGDYLIVARGPVGAGAALWADMPISVGAEGASDVVVQLQPGLSIAGRLAFPDDGREPPDAGRISLGVASAGGGAVSVTVPPVTPEAANTFAIEGLAPGRYVITAAASAGWVAESADLNGRNALVEPFEMAPGGDIARITIDFSDRPAELSGRVADAADRPAAGLTMVLLAAERESWTVRGSDRVIRAIPLDNTGRFRLTDIAPGDYYLAALADVAEADLEDPAYLEQVAASAVRVTLAAGERKTQDLTVGGR